MALTDTFVRTVKPNGKAATKYTDGDGMYLLVTATGKYWRLDYRYLGKRKTLAIGTYPEVSLAKTRGRRGDARTLLADGLVPGDDKRKAKQAKLARAARTFEQAELPEGQEGCNRQRDRHALQRALRSNRCQTTYRPPWQISSITS